MHLDNILVQMFVRNLIQFIILQQVGPKLFKASVLEKNSHWKERACRYTESDVSSSEPPNVLRFVKNDFFDYTGLFYIKIWTNNNFTSASSKIVSATSRYFKYEFLN